MPASPANAAQGSGDAALLARLRSGESAAFEELVRDHGARLLGVAKRLLRHDEDARDAVQDAFFSAFRGLEKFEGEARLSTWLHRIVVNAALMKLRTRRRKPEAPIDDLLPRFLGDGSPRETRGALARGARGRLRAPGAA
ncbi:MAG TPA: sigma-70 family RNA polymerase sigma factor [Myxococcota bacterium]|nr:sigma-70 family RNA polymerase sigma factor [Myxococcota bacterium]